MPWWAFVVAGTLLCVYQAWAIGIRVAQARGMEQRDGRILVGTVLATRGLGFVLGVVLIVAGVARSG
jgi:hypothetical protein